MKLLSVIKLKMEDEIKDAEIVEPKAEDIEKEDVEPEEDVDLPAEEVVEEETL